MRLGTSHDVLTLPRSSDVHLLDLPLGILHDLEWIKVGSTPSATRSFTRMPEE